MGFGRAKEDTPFLIASITKPMTAAGVMVLRDRGELALDDRVERFIPEFTGEGRGAVTIRHLLTHTSGLPDMLPENERLRARHAPLAEFVAAACRTPLLFAPGSKASYQSMGILLAAEIAQRIAKQPFREFLRAAVFDPLGMKATRLGAVPGAARIQVIERSDYDWNSSYWRDLGAPWGGAHSTVDDIARFLNAFDGAAATPWKAATSSEMRTLHTNGLGDAYGLGWRLQPGGFGKGCSAATYGHSGSTGTLCWRDPGKKLTFVLLTSKPAEQSRKTLLEPASDFVSA
jgi:beta-lactamase class C